MSKNWLVFSIHTFLELNKSRKFNKSGIVVEISIIVLTTIGYLFGFFEFLPTFKVKYYLQSIKKEIFM